MALEINSVCSLRCINGAANYAMDANSQTTQTLQGGVIRKQTMPTSDTVIVLTGVTAASFVFIKNLDAINYIDIGPTSGGALIPCARLKAGQHLVMPLTPSVVLRGLANTGAVIIEYMLLET